MRWTCPARRKASQAAQMRANEKPSGSPWRCSVTRERADIARQARVRTGKATGYAAQLSFADCFADALAKTLHAPLSFKGDGFSKTDLRSALR